MTLREAAKKLRAFDHTNTPGIDSQKLQHDTLALVCERLADIAPAADRHDEATENDHVR